ncbi:MAG: chromate transporter, partial [Betaproteobacteria bacterium]
KPAVTAIVVFAAHRIGTRTLRNGALVAIAIAAFVAISAFAVPFPLIVLGAGIAGYIGGRVWPSRFAAGESHDSARSGYGAAVIDDDTPPPPHARFDLRHTIRVTFAGAALLLVPLALLALKFGWTATLTQMAWFFTKAALLTFGGAYAVLPYVLQSAVETYGWLTPAQVIDGLALGETTPGPLIMIVAFVGFVGSHAAALPGTVHPSLSGAAGACIATWFTFLPSFLFILIGGPLVEATHDEIRFTAPLTGVMAAVVGIIVNLAVFFAGHVLWPAGFAGRFEWPALVIGVGATIALMRRRIGVVTVVIGAGLCGLLWQAAR